VFDVCLNVALYINPLRGWRGAPGGRASGNVRTPVRDLLEQKTLPVCIRVIRHLSVGMSSVTFSDPPGRIKLYFRSKSIVDPFVVSVMLLSRYHLPSITILTACSMNKSPLPVGDGHGWPSVAEDMDVERRQRARRRRGEVTNAGSVSLGLCADVLYALWINQVAVLYANCVDFWAGYEVVYAKDCVFWWFYRVYAKFVYTMIFKV